METNTKTLEEIPFVYISLEVRLNKQHTKVDEGRLTHSLFNNIFWFQFQRSHK